jgi:ankyrin repeat protein
MLEYAIEHWAAHARQESTLAESLLEHPSGFFDESSRVRNWWWRQEADRIGYFGFPFDCGMLHLSAYIGFVPWVKRDLVRKSWWRPGVDYVNMLDGNNETPLSYATKQGHGAATQVLLEHGAAASLVWSVGHRLPAIHGFAASGNEMAVRVCLDHGIRLDAAGEQQQTPLHLAASRGHHGTVQLLLSRGAKCDARDADQHTALMLVASHGHDAAVRCLLEHGAGIELTNRNSATAWRLAAEGRHEKVKKMLLDRGALFDGATALCIAASQGNLVEVRLQLEGGVPVDAKNLGGMTALHCAALKGHEAVVQLLIDRGADINAMAYDKRTALHLAVESETHRPAFDTFSTPLFSMIFALLDHGAEVNAEDVNGMTPLHYAVCWRSERLTRLLLDRGAEIDARCSNGRTPLHILATLHFRGREEECMTLMLDRGARLDAKDEYGSTPLYCAVRSGIYDNMCSLLDHGAHINARDHDGRTPLHMAATSTLRASAFRSLLDHGAVINARDNLGLTPLDNAYNSHYMNDNWTVLTQLGAVRGR